MSSKGEYMAPPPPIHGGCSYDKFHARRFQPRMMQRHFLPQQAQQQHCQLQWRAVSPKTESSTDAASEEAKRLNTADGFSRPVAFPVPPSSVTPTSNLEKFMTSVIPIVKGHDLSEKQVNANGWIKGKMSTHYFFYLKDLWESFDEWSAYGAEVPSLLDGEYPVKQYYVPSLSGIQLYIDPSKPSSGLNGNIDSADRRARSIMNLNGLSLGDKSDASSSGYGDGIAKSPSFQFLDKELPFNRRPLSDQVTKLASEYPDLNNCRSCDLLPISWLCVAWYPIYRIPMGPTRKDLGASFLTFHYLSTRSTSTTRLQFYSANKGTGKFSLPAFALASYKLKGAIWSPGGPHECEQENSLFQVADDWLTDLQVVLPDYKFFRNHYFSRADGARI